MVKRHGGHTMDPYYRIAIRSNGTWALFEVYRSRGGWVRHYLGEVV